MASLNQVFLIGRLGRDPELRYSQSGAPICSMTVATNESYTDREGNRQERTEWHRVSAFGKSAESCGKFLHKGSLAFVSGKLQTRKYQGRDGSEKYITEVLSDKIQFLDQRNSGGGDSGYSNASQSPQTAVVSQEPDDGIPF